MNDRPTSALALLRFNRPLRRLVLSRAISLVGSAMGLVALLLHLASSAGVAAVVLLLLAGDLLPGILAPLTGVAADRFERRRLMIACELGQAVATAIIAIWLPPVLVLLALFACRSVLGQIFQAASRTAVTSLVTDEQLPAANAAVGFGEHGIAVLGPLIAALLVPIAGIPGVLLLDAGTFLLSALLILGLPPVAVETDSAAEDSAFRDVLHGLRGGWAGREVRIVIISFTVVVLFNAIDDVALVFLGGDSLDATSSGTSLLYAGSAAGLLVGFAVLGRASALAPSAVLLVAGYLISSLGNLVTGLAWSVPAAIGLQLIRGIGIAAQDVAATTMIQRSVPRAVQGRVFATFYGGLGIAAGISYLAGGLLLQLVGPRLTFVVAGVGGVLAAVVTAFLLPAAAYRRTVPPPPVGG
ncbi:MAG: MFS transporter [Nakamurella sp.]